MQTAIVILAAASLPVPRLIAAAPATPAPPLPECRQTSSAERPKATTDDLANCLFERLGGGRIRVTAAYTYASSLGRQNIFLGVDVLAAGNRLKWFGYRPAPITPSSGTASIEVVFGLNNPPTRTLITDQIELFMYIGGGQIFFRKLFNLRLEWQL
ncbi:MAG: hypothetical protein HY334_00110 [Armatimonadetes bacterium]|nr:hypothetical protein [Armatimonadota bacterium]